jgi:methyl-accepting chemotaxis protein
MILRRITIKNRLRGAMASLMVMIILLCLIGFTSTRGTDSRVGETLRSLEGTIQSQDSHYQSISRNLQRVLDGDGEMRLSFIVLALVSVVMGVGMCFLIQKSIEAPIDKMAYLTSRLADRDLSIDLGGSSADEFQRVKEPLMRQVQEWRALVTQMSSDAADLSSSARELRGGADRMLGGSDEQASRSSQVAAASEEMSETILNIAKNVNGIAQSASGTVVVAKNGDQIVTRSLEKVTEIAHIVDDSANFVKSLGERSEQIGGIVNVINDIADQTNLLALNAAIEAARAGEQGRGFAVVADEVRKLAERTATSTSEIGQMIRAIQDEVSKAVSLMENATSNVNLGVELVRQSGSALQAIVQSADDLQLMVQQIASATEEMSATSSEITKDMEQMASVSKDACETAEGISRTSIKLAQLSEKMEQTANKFKL